MTQGKILHMSLSPELAKKLRRLGRVSRRNETDVVRLLIEDADVEQLGLRQNSEKPLESLTKAKEEPA